MEKILLQAENSTKIELFSDSLAGSLLDSLTVSKNVYFLRRLSLVFEKQLVLDFSDYLFKIHFLFHMP